MLSSIERRLKPRLLMIISKVKKGAVIADIGTDHAYIPIYLTLIGTCLFAFGSDVRKGPLERAQNNVNFFNVSDKIKLTLCYGIDDLVHRPANTFIIAGMGGELIRDIIKKSILLRENNPTLLLQPMSGEKELKKYLYNNGYKITDEDLCREDRRFYSMITARKGTEIHVDDMYSYVGYHLIENKHPLLKDYTNTRINSLEKAISGMEKAAVKDYKEIDKLYKIKEKLIEILKKDI